MVTSLGSWRRSGRTALDSRCSVIEALTYPRGWEAYPIARTVNSPSHEGPQLLAPATAATQPHA